MILMLAAASVSAACLHGPSADDLLNAFRKAAAPTVQARSMSALYSYKGQGLTGTASVTIDLQDGRYVEAIAAGPNKEAAGFDGQLAWMRDLSDVTSPQQGGNRPELARNEAYRNANLWWMPSHGGATVQAVGCQTLRITPLEGEPFDATFDPATHLLKSVREDQSFGVFTTTEYSAYERREGHLLPTRISTLTNDDPGTKETLQLTSVSFKSDSLDSAFQMPATASGNWTLPSTGRVTVPIRLINNHIVTDVRINGRGPFPFMVDTGGHDIVTPDTVKKLCLVSQGESPSFGAGDSAGSNGYSRVATIDAGGAVLHDQTVLTLDFSPTDVEGLQLGGMLGSEFIERFVVRIDYGAKTMTFIDPSHFADSERQASGVAVPFVFYSHMPQVSGTFDGRPVRLDIDTGSRAEVTMTSPFVTRASLRESYPHGVTLTDGWGVGGPSHSYVVRVGSLSLGSAAVANVIAGFSSAKVGAFADRGSEGNVGTGLLKRFAVTFDYARRTLYLNRLANPDADTGRFDRVGMWLNMASGGLRVMDVAPGSPAAEAGLKVGDTIIQIGGHSVGERALSDVRRELKLAPVGAPLQIAYSREHRAATITVTPRNLIPDVAD
jgi:predicted aspartyl protease